MWKLPRGCSPSGQAELQHWIGSLGLICLAVKRFLVLASFLVAVSYLPKEFAPLPGVILVVVHGSRDGHVGSQNHLALHFVPASGVTSRVSIQKEEKDVAINCRILLKWKFTLYYFLMQTGISTW